MLTNALLNFSCPSSGSWKNHHGFEMTGDFDLLSKVNAPME